MKRLLSFACTLIACTLGCQIAASAAPQPPLPKPAATFQSGSLRVQQFGATGKRAVIFIPGLTCGPWEWSREISTFSRSYTVYALTLPGFDGVPAISGPLFQTVTSDFWNLLQTQHIDRPIVIGHSLGGTTGLMLATQHSDRLAGVIAVDGLPIFPGNERQTPAQRAQGAARMKAMLSTVTTPQQFEMAERTYTLPYMVTSKSDVDAIAPLTARSDPAASGAWLAEDLQLDLRPALKNISVPVLEIAPYDKSLDGALLPAAQAKVAYYAGLLAADPTAVVQSVEPSRHFIMYDQPQALDAKLAAFAAGLK